MFVGSSKLRACKISLQFSVCLFVPCMQRENLGAKVEKISLNEIFEHCSSYWLDSKERRLSREGKSTFLLAFSALVNVYI